jgi:hypothetical protein
VLGGQKTQKVEIKHSQTVRDTSMLIKFRLADLPLNFHPAAIRASANVTPFGAVSVPA